MNWPDLVRKIGTKWFVDIDAYEHNFTHGDGSRVTKFGPYPNEATARLAELSFLMGLNKNGIQEIPRSQ